MIKTLFSCLVLALGFTATSAGDQHAAIAQSRPAADPYADERWSALGRYQMRRPALTAIGLLDEDQLWTGKFGIRGWRDFLNNPDAQEAAMIQWSELMEEYARDEGYLRHIGRKITGLKGDITVTEGGLIAAMHNVGGTGLRRYFEWLEAHGWNSRRYEAEMPVRFQPIEARLRAFQDLDYRK